ncbi:MAG TPA: hypothetical protein VHO84_06765, partial [Syntrophorhabdaceae bacterium]|nr:hypothetical protein [Syntrophorhabdaceae bacterium]
MKANNMFSHYADVWPRYEAGLKRAWLATSGLLTYNLMDGVLLPKNCLSLSIEKGMIQAAYGSLFLAKPRIKGFRKYPFDEKTRYAGPENLAWAATQALKEFRAYGAEIVLSMPRELFVVRTAELPITTKENITSVVSYELDRLTPFTSSEAMYDFKIYNERDGKLELIIAAVRSDFLRPYIDAMKEHNLHLSRITLSSAGLGTLCSAFQGNGRDTLCVSTSETGYEGCTTKNGVVSSTFQGAFADTETRSRLDQIAADVEPVINRFKESGTTPAIFVTPVDGLAALQQRIGIPVTIMKQEEVQSKFRTPVGDILYNPLGSLLEAVLSKSKGFNLLAKGRPEQKKTPKALAIALLCIIIAMLVPYLVVPLQIEKAKLNQINANIASRKAEVQRVEALKKEITAAETDISQIRDFKNSKP